MAEVLCAVKGEGRKGEACGTQPRLPAQIVLHSLRRLSMLLLLLIAPSCPAQRHQAFVHSLSLLPAPLPLSHTPTRPVLTCNALALPVQLPWKRQHPSA